MPRDFLVIDIETKNTFDEVGGQQNLIKLDMSLIGVYSYNKGKFFAIREGNFHELDELFKNAALVVGFSIIRFDLPILNKYVNFDLLRLPRVDLLHEIEQVLGRRISLDLLAKENLGVGKTGHGLDAIKYYKEGNWDALEKYCLQDVKVTRDLYELAKKQGYLMVPNKFSPHPTKVELDIKKFIIEAPNTLF